jgi:hypothetical protein
MMKFGFVITSFGICRWRVHIGHGVMMKSCFVIISFSVCRRKDPFAEDEGGKWDVYEAAVGDD